MSSQDTANNDYIPNGLRRSLRKKYAVKSTRVQALFDGMTHRPAVLKEGYLHKPAFFRFGGRRRRWCVLRVYSPVEASLDIFVDDTKTRYKGSICLDKEAQPLILVKMTDSSHRGHLQSNYIVLKVGKNSYHFTTESYRELKEWCALLRQVIDADGSLFSASIVEPNALEDGTVNVQFTSNYIALLCPIKEISIKRWRLEHIASFGQCGGMLTFECCPRCSDPNYSRCSLNIKQEKPSTILTLMEKAIRENPNTGEIHYERSILGDIYHCSHQCSTSPRLLPALSDSNLLRINNISSPYSNRKKPEDLKVSIPSSDLRRHGSDVDLTMLVHSNTLESNDSGLPGTPQLEDSPRSSAFISSPTCTNGKPSSPTKKSVKISSPSHRSRCNSDTANRYTQLPFRDSVTPGRETDDSESGFVTHSMLLHQHSEPRQNGSLPSSIPRSGSPSKTVTPVARSWTPSIYNKLETVTESNNLSPPPPPARRESRFRPVSKSPPNILPKHSSPIKSAHIPNGAPPPPPKLITRVKSESKTTSDTSDHESRLEQVRDSSMDRDHPIADLSLPEVPSRHRSGTHILHRELPPTLPRERTQSQSDVLEVSRPSPSKVRGISKSTSDELDDDEEDHMCYEYDTLSELKEINPFFRLEDLEYDETDGEGAHEVMSNLADYRRHKNGYCEPAVIDKVLNKVASENVRGYAYKISIPVAGNVVYDVPRRSAPMADPKHINPNAPPKPLRKVNKNGHVIEQKSPLSQGNLHSREVSIEA